MKNIPFIFSKEKGSANKSDPQTSAQDSNYDVALSEIDNARIGTAHIRAVVVDGTGFFTDAYDLFSANFITQLIGRAYYPDGVIPSTHDTAIKLSTTAGAVVGQVFFGWLADKLGRKRMYGIELMIILVGTVGRRSAPKVHRSRLFCLSSSGVLLWESALAVIIRCHRSSRRNSQL